MILFLFFGCFDESGNINLGEIYAPKFTTTKADTDESCAVLTDYCLRVSCSIQNVGNAAGEAAVEIYLSGENETYKETKRVNLKPGDTKSISHNFTQAKLLDGLKGYTAKCEPR